MYCKRHHIFVDYGDPCPVCLNDLDNEGSPHCVNRKDCDDEEEEFLPGNPHNYGSST